MGNGKRTPRKPWVVFGRALAVSLGIYLAGHLLLAALLVRGTVGEGVAFAVTAGLCVISSAVGAFWQRGRREWDASREPCWPRLSSSAR